jgi:hypothetical protein
LAAIAFYFLVQLVSRGTVTVLALLADRAAQ